MRVEWIKVNAVQTEITLDMAMLSTQKGREILAKFFKAAGEPTRLSLLSFLAGGEHSASECVAHVGLAQGRVSSHLSCLVSCGLLEVVRKGRFAFYEVTDARVVELIRLGTTIALDNVESVANCAIVGEPMNLSELGI